MSDDNNFVTYDDLFEEEWQAAFSAKSLISLAIKLELEKIGISLTEEQFDEISQKVASHLDDGNTITIDMDDEIESVIRTRLGVAPKEKINVDISNTINFDLLIENLPEIREEAYQSVVQRWGEISLELVMEEAKLLISEEQAMRLSFQQKLHSCWGEALDLLQVFITLSREAGNDVLQTQFETGQSELDHVFEALVLLHARACQIASEIHVLLRNGYADGAHARWRSLHEIAVISNFLAKHGEPTAERYLLYDAIESWKSALSTQRFAHRLNIDPPDSESLARLKKARQALIFRFGEPFGERNGWAAYALKRKRVCFSDIEADVDFEHWRPYYKMASNNVHADPKGTLFRLGTPPNAEFILSGASIFGLTDPGHGAAISLLQTTVTLLTHETTTEALVRLSALTELEREIGEAFFSAQEQLEEDEAE